MEAFQHPEGCIYNPGFLDRVSFAYYRVKTDIERLDRETFITV